MPAVVQRSFSSGEIAPVLFGRVDLQKYQSGLRTCRNFVVMRHGGVSNRPGLQFVAEVRDSTNVVRLIPFIFNQQSGQTFILEFSDLRLRFYQNGGQVVEAAVNITGATQANPCVITANAHGYSNGDEVVISGIVGMTQLNGRNFLVANSTANTFSLQDKGSTNINSAAYTAYSSGGTVQRVYTIVSPYAVADIAALKYAQTNDVITIVHPSYAPRQLQRLGATNWQFKTITLFSNDSNNYVTGGSMSGTAGTPNPWNNYMVTAVTANGEETALNAYIATPAAAGAIALATSTTPVTLSWTAPVNGASFYRVYVSTQRSVGAPPYAQGPLGFVGSTTDIRFVDTGFIPNYSVIPPNFFNKPFAGSNDWPSAIGFVQQRLALANSVNKPTTIWLSQPSDFTNLDYHALSSQDADGIVFVPASEQVNQIQHLVQMRTLLVLTDASEINVRGDGNNIIKPSAINPLPQSFYGSGSLRPLVIGDTVIFQQSRGWFVRDLGYDFSVDQYRGNDLTIFSPHLFQNFTLSDWAFQQTPNSIVWGVRSDGAILGMTYLREQQILAWHRHDVGGGTASSQQIQTDENGLPLTFLGNGFAENVACIPESPEDSVYFCIRRTINGRTVRYIERMAPFNWSDVINAPYLDSWLKFDGRNTGSTTMTLSGGTNWTYTESLTLTASSGFFLSSMVGQQIFLNDSLGNQIRCMIMSFTSSTVVTVKPNATVPTTLRNTAITNWAQAIQTVTNLYQLEGQKVSVFADRFVVASVYNKAYPTYTVTNGTITLDKPYSVIYVGLPITSDLETLDVDMAFGETLIGKAKMMSRVRLYLVSSRGGFSGAANPDTEPLNTTADPLYRLAEYKDSEDRLTYDAASVLRTDSIYINAFSNWNKNGRMFVRHIDPLPQQIVAVAPTGDLTKDNPAWARG